MRLKLTLFKFPFVAFELAIAGYMLKHAWFFREEWPVVVGSLGVTLMAIGGALYVLIEEEHRGPGGTLRP
jgi:hypothetical protein